MTVLIHLRNEQSYRAALLPWGGTAFRRVGVILFHHGSYFTGGKEAILEVIGGTAWASVVWNTNEGQNGI